MLNFSKRILRLLIKGLNLSLFLIIRFGYFLLHFYNTTINPTKIVLKQIKVPLLKLPKVKIPKVSLNYSGLKGPAFFAFGIAFCLLFVVIPTKLLNLYKTLPNPDTLIVESSKKSTRILDRNNRLLYEIYADKNSAPVKLEQISPYLVNATLAVEDHEFYKHGGFRIVSILRAAKETFFDEHIQGGSTITQQLVKNVLLSPERTFTRKLKELALAVFVETKYTKNQILEMYLNNISYGGTTLGIQSAAQKFFGKNAWELTLAESALLAGLPTAPSVYSPVSGDAEKSKEQQQYVLSRMVKLGYITQAEADGALAQQLTFLNQKDFIRAPHFVNYIKDLLVVEFGQRYVLTGGFTVVTSLDLDIQDRAQKFVSDEVYKSASLKITNGASVVLDAQTGEILAYVGSVDYFKPGWGSYDSVLAKRQPGSSIKPITYALALQNGYTPATLIEDTPLVIKNQWETYAPNNYDGKFHGLVTLRAALANSYNIPAVRLVSKLGPSKMVQLGKDMGLNDWEADGSYGVSVTLGGKEVSLLDLTNTYGTFARNGTYTNVKPILSILDVNGYNVFYPTNVNRPVLDEGVAYTISNILSDNAARTPAFGFFSKLVIPNKTVAVKTGTTDYKRDNWTIGYTPKYVVGVWVGNNDNQKMDPRLASGLSGAAPIWNNVMSGLLNSGHLSAEESEFKKPESIVVKFDPECGNKSEIFIKGSKIPDHLCVIAKKDTRTASRE